MVTIGSARISENGTVSGVVGDQTGKECSTQGWYLSKKGWYLCRPVNPTQAEKIAKCMEMICNGNVGYSQPQRSDLYNKVKQYAFDVSKLGNAPANVDCSEAVRVCLAYAGINVNTFTTANEINVLNATKVFDILTSDIYCKTDEYIKRGDILCSRTKGHTVVCLTNGAKHNSIIHPQLQRGDKGYHTLVVQKLLNQKNIMGGNLVLDSDFGSITLSHLIEFCGLNDLPKTGKVDMAVWNKLLP